MAVGERGGISSKHKKRLAAAEAHHHDQRELEQTPSPPLNPPSRRPIAVLEKQGHVATIDEVNERVQRVTDAHERALGFRPSPGLVLDVVRSRVPPDQIDRLFELPTSKVARARSQYNHRDFAEPVDDPVRTELQAAIRSRNLIDFIEKYGEDTLDSMLADKRIRPQLVRAFHERDDPNPLKWQHIALSSPALIGLIPLRHPIKSTKQVATALKDIPGGIIATGSAIHGDVSDTLKGDPTAKRTGQIAKGTAQSIKQDFEDPEANPGFLALDLLGLGSGSAGTVARLGAASRATTASGAAKALVTRPTGSRQTIRKGEMEEEVLLSENPLVAATQRTILDFRQKKLDLRHFAEGEPVPAGLLGRLRLDRAQEFLDNNFSLEAKLRREFAARKRVEFTLQMELKRELDHVAGWSVAQARALSRLPKFARKGLTRGEQMAILVMSIDDPTPLQTMRSFHERMIEMHVGFEDAHRRKLIDLKLAEKVLNDPRPRDRFLKAADLTRRVVEEQQGIKIEKLGLSPITADARVAGAGEVLREGKRLEGDEALERESGLSFYMPTLSKRHTKKATRDRYGFHAPRVGVAGIPPPKLPPELRHQFTGEAIIAGDYRIDATALASDAYARTVKTATVLDDYQRLLKASTATRRTEYDVPIREETAIPDELREVLVKIDEGELTHRDAEVLSAQELQSIRQHLFPDKGEIEGVRWVDGRLLGDEGRVPPPSGVRKAAQTFNEPFRIASLYARPAYILNALGNSAMLLFDEGVLAVPNFVRALRASKLYGEKTTRTLDALVGEGKALSYVARELDPNFVTKGGHVAARAWSVITDRMFRRASMIHYLRRHGYDTREKIEALLKDEGKRADLVEIKRRANKAMVEFDNLTWYEKQYLRHVVFVYPWVSRSTVWSIRALLEHPIESDVLAHIAEISHEDEDKAFKNAPEWAKRIGYVVTGWTPDGRPKVINPTSVNTFSTIGEMLAIGESQVRDVQYVAGEDVLGPTARFMIHAFTGRDEFGNEYETGNLQGAFMELVKDLPLLSAYERSQKENKPLKPIDVANRKTLIQRQNAALERLAFTPGAWGDYGSFFVGGFAERIFETDAAAARFWRDQPLKERHKHEMALVRKVLTMQGDLLQTKPTRAVKDAVELAGKIELAKKEFAEEHGDAPRGKRALEVTIDVLQRENRLSGADADRLRKTLKPLAPEQLDTFQKHLLAQYAGARDLQSWDRDVRFVASFQKGRLERKINALASQGLANRVTIRAGQEALYEYGRKALAYEKEAEGRIKEARGLPKSEATVVYAQIRAWQDEQDKSIRVGDHLLPSPVRIAWAHLTPRTQREAIQAAVTAAWDKLSAFDKELAGRKSSAAVTRGWAEYQRVLNEARQETPGISISREQRIGLAKQIGREFPGFYEDYLFSQQPTIHRFVLLKPYQEMNPEAKALFDQHIAPDARRAAQAIASGDYSSGDVRAYWRKYTREVLAPWVASNPVLATALAPYGPDFLGSLVGR